MAGGFSVKETIDRPVDEVWHFMSDMRNAPTWMTGVEDMKPITPGPTGIGSKFSFVSRGAERDTEVTAWDPKRELALTSTQGGITATYLYTVHGNEDSTEVALHAVCEAEGLWKIVQPLIAHLMKRSDSGHLAQLRDTMDALNR